MPLGPATWTCWVLPLGPGHLLPARRQDTLPTCPPPAAGLLARLSHTCSKFAPRLNPQPGLPFEEFLRKQTVWMLCGARLCIKWCPISPFPLDCSPPVVIVGGRRLLTTNETTPVPPLNSNPTSSPHLSLSFLTWDFHATQRSQKLTERENAWPKCPSWRL